MRGLSHQTLALDFLSPMMQFPQHMVRLHKQCFRVGRCFSSASTTTTNVTSTNRVRVDIDAATQIAHVRLNRADKLNALDMDMFRAIRQAAVDLQNNRSVRAVVLSGEGRAFCTGLDVTSMMTKENPVSSINQLLERHGDDAANLAQDVGYRWRQLDIPVIAALHGMCFGGGMQIALGADIRLATPDCRLSIMESKWGLIPDMSASVTLRELVRIDVAKELTMTGRIVSGAEAAQLGLITRTSDDPIAEALEMAKTMTQRSPDALALSKKLYQSTWVAVPEDYCLTVETALQKQLLATWNQLAASGRNFGWKIPYFRRRRKYDVVDEPEDSQG